MEENKVEEIEIMTRLVVEKTDNRSIEIKGPGPLTIHELGEDCGYSCFVARTAKGSDVAYISSRSARVCQVTINDIGRVLGFTVETEKL